MRLCIQFEASTQSFDPDFGAVNIVSDGGYERGYDAGYADGYGQGVIVGTEQGYASGFDAGEAKGYADGHAQGYAEGEAKGYADGLAARSYETWTLTLADGSTVEKEVALL